MKLILLASVFLALNVVGCGQDEGVHIGANGSVSQAATDGDNGSTATTCAQSAITYPMNRVWNPSNSLLANNSCSTCVTTSNHAGKLQSKCDTLPSTCGFLFCIATP